MHSPDRLVLPGAEKARNKLLESNPKLQAAVAGKELVKVRAEDVGVEAIGDYRVRIYLSEICALTLLNWLPIRSFVWCHGK